MYVRKKLLSGGYSEILKVFRIQKISRSFEICGANNYTKFLTSLKSFNFSGTHLFLIKKIPFFKCITKITKKSGHHMGPRSIGENLHNLPLSWVRVAISKRELAIKYLQNVYGRFHVTFSLTWTVGNRFRSNFGRAFVIQKKVSSQIFSSKKFFFGVSTVLLFVAIFFEQKLFFATFATKGLDR